MRTEYNGLIITGTPEELMVFAQLVAPKPKPEQKTEPKAAPNKDAASKKQSREDAASKKQTTKKELDMGKVKALRNAGWSFGKIADEMGCSSQTIANRMKEHEQ